MENAEEILQCLDEFAKLRPKEIPPELEYYLSFVARTGDPVYQWPLIKCLFREKLINVITEFYEACPSIEIPPCPNVEIFNYEAMKGFILEKLDTFAAAPFTVQRICELLTSPRKEYNRIDKYMRALEKNILVVSTREPGNRKSTENGESVVNGLESEHASQEMVNSLNSDINVEVDMDEKSVWHKSYAVNEASNIILETESEAGSETESIQIQEAYVSESKSTVAAQSTTASGAVAVAVAVAESVITARQMNYIGYATSEMVVEPSTTITIGNSEDVATAPAPHGDESSGVPLAKEGGERRVFAAEDSAFMKADCSEQMDTSQHQAMCETETEPITPPEPDETPQQPDKGELPESSVVEAVVESTSSSQSSTTTETTTPTTTETVETTTETVESELELEKKLVESSSNETSITSSDEMPQCSTEPSGAEAAENNAEVTASDHQEVTESNIVIGPEDMQVEDISPEPETEAEAEAETETKAEAVIAQEPKSPEEKDVTQPEELSAVEDAKTEQGPPREEIPQNEKEEDVVANVTESN